MNRREFSKNSALVTMAGALTAIGAAAAATRPAQPEVAPVVKLFPEIRTPPGHTISAICRHRDRVFIATDRAHLYSWDGNSLRREEAPAEPIVSMISFEGDLLAFTKTGMYGYTPGLIPSTAR